MRRIPILLVTLALLAGAALADEQPTAAARLLAEGDRLFGAREYAAATARYLEASAAAEAAGEPEVLVEALAMAARGHLIREDAKGGRPYLERAGALVKDDMARGTSRYLGVLGRFQWKDGDRPGATQTFERMYAFCMDHGLHDRAVDAAHMVAITGTKEQQVEWARKGIAAAERGGMDGWLGPLWNNLAVTFHESGDDEQALDAYRKARDHHWKVGSEVNKLLADWAIGMTLRQLGRNDEARTWLRPVLAWAERRHAERTEPERGEHVGLALLELGLVAKAEGRVAEARRDLSRAKPLLEAVRMHEWHPELWKDLTDALAGLAADAATSDEHLTEARVLMRSIAHRIDLYRLANKKLPADLEALVRPLPGSDRSPAEPVPLDPWGRPFRYRQLDRSTYELRSDGPDGEPDTSDDLTHP